MRIVSAFLIAAENSGKDSDKNARNLPKILKTDCGTTHTDTLRSTAAENMYNGRQILLS